MHESQMHDANSFVTLTYSDEFCPVTLVHGHFQRFMKRLRHHFPGARYFMCGEYGERTNRPHFHACLFGVSFPDRVFHGGVPPNETFTSKLLSELWPFGHAVIGSVTFESAGYVAGYVTKKVTGDDAYKHYERMDVETGEIVHCAPEYGRMSLKPGIGATWFEKFSSDVYSGDKDSVVLRGGVKSKPPRYYDKLLDRSFPGRLDLLKVKRLSGARERAADNTRDRLVAKERVARARLRLKRKFVE